MRHHHRFQDLVGRLLDDVCSPAQRDELAELCQEYPEFLTMLRDALELDQMVAQNVVVNRCEESFAGDFSVALEAKENSEVDLPDFDDLASRYLDSNLRPHEARRLHALCLRNPDQARQLRQSLEFVDLLSQAVNEPRNEGAFVDGLVTRMWAETATDHFVDDLASKIVAIGAFQTAGSGGNSEEGFAEGRDSVVPMLPGVRPAAETVKGHGWGRTLAFAAAAAVAAALTVLVFIQSPDGGNGSGGIAEAGQESSVGSDAAVEPASIAMISESSDDVQWAGEAVETIGQNGEVGIGRYQLAAGVVRVRFSSGAEMTVEGPAEFEVRSSHEAYVHSGLAMARSEKPGDLQVQSKGIELVDVDRTVAVDARFDDFTEAVFFDGPGEIRMSSQVASVNDPGNVSPDQLLNTSTENRSRKLYPLETVRADHERDRLLDVPYNPGVFSRTWQLISGVSSNSGSVEVELPGAVVIPDERDVDKVQVFMEKDGFVATGGLEVDLLTPGKFTSVAETASAGGATGVQIQPKGELRSYLLQRWAPSRDGETLQASVTFADPVVGVIFSADKLEQSDELVGAELAALKDAMNTDAGRHGVQYRGIDQGDGEDSILLSDDGRTLSFVLRGGNEDVLDHIRVLVSRQ